MVKVMNVFKNDSFGVRFSKNLIVGVFGGFLFYVLLYFFDYCRIRLVVDILYVGIGGKK